MLVACGGGGGGGTSPLPGNGGGPAPMPTATLPPTASGASSISTSAGATIQLAQIASGASGSVTFAATTTGSATATLTLQSTLPTGDPTPQQRRRFNLGGAVTPIAYATLTLSAPVTISKSPAFAMTFPAGTLSGNVYLAFFDPNNAQAGWNLVAGPVAGSGTSVSFAQQTFAPPISLAANVPYAFAIVETGTPLPTPTPMPATTPTPIPSGSPLTGPSLSPQGAWGPPAVAQALDFPVQHGYNGAGQTVAILIDADPTTTADLTTFLSYFQIPTTGRTISSVPVDGGSFAPDTEADLDTQTIAALAPGANVLVYVIPDLSGRHILDGYNKILSDNKANVVSSSFGGCEFAGTTGNGEDLVFSQGAANGMAFVASSGDQGNECFTGLPSPQPAYTPGPGYPASDPNVIGVGGSETNKQLGFTLTSNVAWNDNTFGNPPGQGATGGGVSAFFTIPTFQSNVSGVASSTYRNVPDVAMPAEFAAIHSGGTWGIVDGTSWAAPEFAALLAEVYEYCNGPIKNPATIPYAAYGLSASAFLDVTSIGNAGFGATNSFGGATPAYTANAGYDNVTGLGVPKGQTFAQTICPNHVLASRQRAASMSVGTAVAQRGPAQDIRFAEPAQMNALSDLGRRSIAESTDVQLVLRPTSTLASDEGIVIAALRNAGFQITQTFGNHLVVDAQAPSGTVERFFATEMHNVSQDQGIRYMPRGGAVIPASIAPYVAAVNLDNLIIAKTRVHMRSLGF